MKRQNIFSVIILIFIFSIFSYAQQDYQIVQKFKAQCSTIKTSIANASSLDELNSIRPQIDQLKSDFEPNKKLLDKSLYPDDFNSSIGKLNDALNLRKGDFTQITTLQTKVSQMQVQLDSLNAKNAMLLNRVQELVIQGDKDRHTILVLQRNLRELRFSLSQRDLLVMTMLDSLLPSSYSQSGSLSSSEKQKIYSKARSMDIITNIKKAISDNIQFLDVTALTPEDLNSIKNQKAQFEKIWKNVGPEIIKIYSSKKQSEKDINEINSDFDLWNTALSREAWNSIRQTFSDRGIMLEKFSSGGEFSNSISSYVNDEIKNADLNAQNAVSDYHTFIDSIWLPKVEPEWIPYLTENNMLSVSDKDKINSKLTEWKKAVLPGQFNWLFVIIPVIIILLIVILLKTNSDKKKKLELENYSRDN